MIAALQSDDNDKRQKWKKDIKNDKSKHLKGQL